MKDDREVQGKKWKIKWTNISALLITRLEKNAANDKHATGVEKQAFEKMQSLISAGKMQKPVTQVDKQTQ